jgi:hypothetical protein
MGMVEKLIFAWKYKLNSKKIKKKESQEKFQLYYDTIPINASSGYQVNGSKSEL